MVVLDGKVAARQVYARLQETVAARLADPPHIVFVRLGEDPASVVYVGKKQREAAKIGVRSTLLTPPETIAEADLLAEIDRLNADPTVHGILVQAPLPSHLDEQVVFNRVAPEKDVDGFSAANLGRLVQGDPEAFVACTPAGVVELLRQHDIKTAGKHVVVVGRSLIVGKPAALLFLQKGPFADATVTVCHSRTPDLGAVTRQADILIAAIGRPEMITGEMVKPGAVVVDVGINRVDDPARPTGYRLVGDVEAASVRPICAALTPVPGGVGPMTVAMLLHNTVKAAGLQLKLS